MLIDQERDERPTPIKTEQDINGLHPDVDDDYSHLNSVTVNLLT
jgi:hypothetical protein